MQLNRVLSGTYEFAPSESNVQLPTPQSREVSENLTPISQSRDVIEFPSLPSEASSHSKYTKTYMSFTPEYLKKQLLLGNLPESPTRHQIACAIVLADISGFTRLSSVLGSEELKIHTNNYFSRLLGCISRHNGDVIKFCGDAVIIIWQVEHADSEFDVSQTIEKSAECALALVHECGTYTAGSGRNTVELRLHCGIAYGPANVFFVGTHERREFLISGKILNEVGLAESEAKKGQVVSAPSTWSVLSKSYIGIEGSEGNVLLMHAKTLSPQDVQSPLSNNFNELNSSPNAYRRASSSSYNWPCDVSKISTDSNAMTPTSNAPSSQLEPYADYLRSFVHESARYALESAGNVQMSELRTVITLFVNIDLSPFDGDALEIDVVQTIFMTCMSSIIQFDGCLRQFVIDDKGCVLIAAFGVPQFAHEDDGPRSVQTASLIHTLLQNCKYHIDCSIGISRGLVYCGLVGNDSRCEYAMMGCSVNLAARLMTVAAPILVDNETFKVAHDSFTFSKQDPISAKGYADPITVYRPIESKTPQDRSAVGRKPRTPVKAAIKPTALFVGRSEEIMEIQKHLQSSKLPIAIVAPRGIGKKELVKNCTMQHQSSYGDISYFNLDSDKDSFIVKSLAELSAESPHSNELSTPISTTSDYTSVDSENMEEQIAAICNLAKPKPSLIVLFNLHEVSAPVMQSLITFLGHKSSNQRIIITSEPTLTLEALHCQLKTLCLAPLSLWECFQLVKHIHVDRSENVMALSKEIYLRCNGNPGDIIFLCENEISFQATDRGSQSKLLYEFDKMTTLLQNMAKFAAISDRPFDSELASCVRGSGLASDVSRVLREGISRKIFVTKDYSTYSFVSTEVRSHVYNLMLKQQRYSYHLMLANYFESSAILDDNLEAAYHYLVGQDNESFIRVLVRLQSSLIQKNYFKKALGVGIVLFNFLLRLYIDSESQVSSSRKWLSCFQSNELPKLLKTAHVLLLQCSEVLEAQDVDCQVICCCILKGKHPRPFWGELNVLLSLDWRGTEMSDNPLPINSLITKTKDTLLHTSLVNLLACAAQLCHFRIDYMSVTADSLNVLKKKNNKTTIYSENVSNLISAFDFLSISTLESQLSSCEWNDRIEQSFNHNHRHDFLGWTKQYLKGEKLSADSCNAAMCSCGINNGYHFIQRMLLELCKCNFDIVVSQISENISADTHPAIEQPDIDCASILLVAWANLLNGNVDESHEMTQHLSTRTTHVTDSANSEGLSFNIVEYNISILKDFQKVLCRNYSLVDPQDSSPSHLIITVLLFLQQGLVKEAFSILDPVVEDAVTRTSLPSIHFPIDLLCFGYAGIFVIKSLKLVVNFEELEAGLPITDDLNRKLAIRAANIIVAVIDVCKKFEKSFKNDLAELFGIVGFKVADEAKLFVSGLTFKSADRGQKLDKFWNLLSQSIIE